MAAKQPSGRPYRAAKTSVGALDRAEAGIQSARTRMAPKRVKTMAVLKRPTWSPAQGGKMRPKKLHAV